MSTYAYQCQHEITLERPALIHHASTPMSSNPTPIPTPDPGREPSGLSVDTESTFSGHWAVTHQGLTDTSTNPDPAPQDSPRTDASSRVSGMHWNNERAVDLATQDP